jgi:hypothetical protein
MLLFQLSDIHNYSDMRWQKQNPGFSSLIGKPPTYLVDYLLGVCHSVLIGTLVQGRLSCTSCWLLKQSGYLKDLLT